MKSILLILLLLVVFVEQSQAFSIPVSYGIKRASFTKLYESPIDDEVALQEELNAMAEGSGGGGSGGSGADDDDDLPNPLYNAAPLGSGVIITVFSCFLTFYGFYAGLSGTDPLFDQYPPLQ